MGDATSNTSLYMRLYLPALREDSISAGWPRRQPDTKPGSWPYSAFDTSFEERDYMEAVTGVMHRMDRDRSLTKAAGIAVYD